MALAPGTKIGPYEIVASIGAGGMGEVYRAKDARLGREVAIKVLPQSVIKDADRLRRFEQEARSVAALNHPNILAIHDVGEMGATPYLVSELLDGHTLKTELETGAIPVRKATDYAAQIAQGLAAAHGKNIIHRDLKPDNVFITREGRVKILDFGLAKLAANTSESSGDAALRTMTSLPTEAGVVLGTVGYMAPEQVRGTAVDSRADIFAFGAVSYEMVTGRRAFQRDTAAETMTAILKEDPPDLPDSLQPVSPGLERIMRRCLEKQPEQRFQSAKDLAFALEALSGPTSSKTSASGAMAAAAAEAAQQKKSAPWLSWIASAAVVAAVIGVEAWLISPRPLPPPSFERVSFERGQVLNARFAQDGKTVVYSGRLGTGPLDTFVIRAGYPESVSAGFNGALLLAVSRADQLAVIVRAQNALHKEYVGTLATVSLGGGSPRELMDNVTEADWSPDGSEMAVVIVDTVNRNMRLEYPIGKVLVPMGSWISGMRISPDGKRVAYFRHPPNDDERGDVVVIDRDGKQNAISTNWASVQGLAWAPSGKEVWFSATASGEEYCLRAATLSAKTRTLYCGTASTIIQDVLPGGRTLVSSEEQRAAMELVQHGQTEGKDLSWLNNAYNPRLSPDGSLVLFTDQSSRGGNEYSVYVRKTDGSPAAKIGSGEFGADLSPDGKWALLFRAEDPQQRIQVVPVGAGQAIVLRWDGISPNWGRWLGDGQHIFFWGSPKGQPDAVYLTDRGGTTPKLISKNVFWWPAGSLDSKSIIVDHDGKDAVLTLADGKEKPIPGMYEGEHVTEWSSEPNVVYVAVPVPDARRIDKLNIETGKREIWQVWKPKDAVGLAPQAEPPAITPDGSKMMFVYRRELSTLYRSDNLK